LAVKRLDRLIGAFGGAQKRLEAPVGLVLVGGHPGEWEGEHPAEIASRLGIANVFLAGWQSQPELPDFFSAAEAVVLTSEREQFCGYPPSPPASDRYSSRVWPRWDRRRSRRWANRPTERVTPSSRIAISQDVR
jgi:hypothetical protein